MFIFFLGVTTSKEELFFDSKTSLLAHFDHFMSQKKMHEVLMMSELLSALCEHAKVTNLVDVGSGKAYLSQVLAAMRRNLQILAIDSQKGNLQGAQKRSANLEVRTYLHNVCLQFGFRKEKFRRKI